VLFAVKAFPCAPVLAILAQEGLGFDVASAGELALALAAGGDPEQMVLHGNAKTDADIGAAIDAGVGRIAIDSSDDLDRLLRLAPERGQRVLVRVNPAVATGAHASVDTGGADAKFGVPLAQVPSLLARVEQAPRLRLDGLHVHVGSQLLTLDGIVEAARVLGSLGAFDVYDLGGGLAIPYEPGELTPTVEAYADTLVTALRTHLPPDARLLVEPGRAITGPTCVTLYTVVTVKEGARTHVAVDGGMGDNLEPALYGTRFAPLIDGRCDEYRTCDLVGRHCESGDVLARDVPLAGPRIGDLVVMPCTGAYCYALLNNYNGARRPPVVLCADGSARAVVRRERLEDLRARDLV
jgi:diaminopimelate decarboxylase